MKGEKHSSRTPVEIEVQKVKFLSIKWGHKLRRTKYDSIYKIIKKLRMNTAIKVTLNPGTKDMYQLVKLAFKNKNFKIKIKRMELDGKVWVFAKVPLKNVT